MAVHERTYRPYSGELTAERWRFLIIPRHAYREVFRSRLFLLVFAGCFIAPAVAAVVIYVRHNASALLQLNMDVADIVSIDAAFFYNLLGLQAVSAYVLSLLVGPQQVSKDLADNALPLYLSRPFSRAEYVLGKSAVVVILLSAVTWVPMLTLFLLQATLEGSGWLGANLRIGGAILAASWIWIVVLTLMALAASAWVRRLPVARGALLGAYVVPAGFGATVNEIVGTTWGDLLSLPEVIRMVWAVLFGVGHDASWGDAFGQVREPPPTWSAALVLLILCLSCLFLLSRKVQAYEVKRA